MSKAEESNVLNITNVDSGIEFWMIRSNGGYYYDEFIEKEFVALGWNVIDKGVLDNIKDLEDNKDERKVALKETISIKFAKNKNPMQSINKCIHFVYDICEGDILMIVGAKSRVITFAKAGAYYEEDHFTHSSEINAQAQIDGGHDANEKIKCPYRKRRKIEIVKTVSGSNLNPNLYKALNSYHGLSRMKKEEYASFVLSEMYSCYIWGNKVNLVFKVRKKCDIGAYDFSSFIYNNTKLIGIFDPHVKVYAKSNVNSNGDIVISLYDNATKIADYLGSFENIAIIFIVWLVLAGGEITAFGITIKQSGIINILERIIDLKYRAKFNQLSVEEKKSANKKMKLEIQELEAKLNNKETERIISEIIVAANHLEIEKEEAAKVIYLSDYLDDDE